MSGADMENWSELIVKLGAGLWREILYILPFLMLGVLLEAIIRTFKWHVKIRKALTHFGALSIVVATLLGLVSPLCACATLPLVISLLLAGLPLAPAMSLLVTSPLMSPAGYTLLNWELGTLWANVVVVCALFMGLYAGYSTHFLRRYGFPKNGCSGKSCPKGISTIPIIRWRSCAVTAASSSRIGSTAAPTTSFWSFSPNSGKGCLKSDALP